jgi:hypothetical protein
MCSDRDGRRLLVQEPGKRRPIINTVLTESVPATWGSNVSENKNRGELTISLDVDLICVEMFLLDGKVKQ